MITTVSFMMPYYDQSEDCDTHDYYSEAVTYHYYHSEAVTYYDYCSEAVTYIMITTVKVMMPHDYHSEFNSEFYGAS